MELLDGLHIVSDIQYYLDYIFKKYREKSDNLPIKISINKIGNRITFNNKTKYYLELLRPEILKLFRSTENKTVKDKNGKNVPLLDITEIRVVTL